MIAAHLGGERLGTAADHLHAQRAQPLADLVRLVASGELRPLPGTAYPLEDARRAHEDMRARRTTGKVTLTAR